MTLIKFSRVISVSSEDPKHPGGNLLKPEISGCWKCKDTGEKQAVIILQLEKLCKIQSITIGNENSAFVEVLVGKSAVPDSYVILRVASVLMSVQDAKNDSNKNVVRFFKWEEFSQPAADQSWDRLKIICSQPFNKHVQYGLSFVKVHGTFDNTENSTVLPAQRTILTSLGKFALKKEERSDDQPKVGSFFARRNDIDNMSTAAAIRAASNDPIDALNSPTSKRLSDAVQDLKESKRKRKRDYTQDLTASVDGRRSTTGPLLYADAACDDDVNDLPKKKREAQVDTSSTSKNTNDASVLTKRKNEAKDDKSTTSKKTNSVKKLKNDTESSESRKMSDITWKPFNRLLEGVTFVISGYQNPLRGELRSKALQMGAKYKADWDSSCTHLICAFTNTPKSNQVRGSGWIVRKDWIEDCHRLRKRLKCLGYKLDKSDTFDDSNDEEIWEDKFEDKAPSVSIPAHKPEKPKRRSISSIEVEPVPGNSSTSALSDNVYDMETDVDSDQENSATKIHEDVTLRILPDFFDKKTFYLGADLLSSIVEMLTRYIVAYKGNVLDDIDNVNFIISGNARYKQNAYNTPVILPDWVWECNDQKSLIPMDHYLLE